MKRAAARFARAVRVRRSDARPSPVAAERSSSGGTGSGGGGRGGDRRRRPASPARWRGAGGGRVPLASAGTGGGGGAGTGGSTGGERAAWAAEGGDATAGRGGSGAGIAGAGGAGTGGAGGARRRRAASAAGGGGGAAARAARARRAPTSPPASTRSDTVIDTGWKHLRSDASGAQRDRLRRFVVGVGHAAAHLERDGRPGRRQQLLPRHRLVPAPLHAAGQRGGQAHLPAVRRRQHRRDRLRERHDGRHAPGRLRALSLRRDRRR